MFINIVKQKQIIIILALGTIVIIWAWIFHTKSVKVPDSQEKSVNPVKGKQKFPQTFNPQFFIDRWNIKNKLASGGSAGLPDEQEREKQRQKLLYRAARNVFSISKDYQDADDYIKRRSQVSKVGCIDYPEVAAMVGPEQLPQLYNMLHDPAYGPYYHNIIRMIGYAGHDEKSADVLWDFFQRDPDYWNDESSPNNKIAKIVSLVMIGINGTEKYDPMLRKAATAEGARELSAHWINSPFLYKKMGFYSPDDVIRRIQFLAFEGLTYTQRPENIEFVRQIYQQEYAACTANNAKSKLISNLVDVMGNQDYIADNCLEYLLILQSYSDVLPDDRAPYFQKYRWRPKD